MRIKNHGGKGRTAGIAEGRIAGKVEGAEEKQQSIIQSLGDVLSPKMIAETLQLSLEYVEEVLHQERVAG